MANITPTITRIMGQGSLDGWQVKWGPMANGDVGLPVGSTIGDGAGAIVPSGGSGFFAGYADKSIQVSGTFGAGGSVACEGSNDGGSNYFAMTDPSQTVIAITAAGGKSVTEATIWVRPHVTAGDGTTSLTATMFFRKTQTP